LLIRYSEGNTKEWGKTVTSSLNEIPTGSAGKRMVGRDGGVIPPTPTPFCSRLLDRYLTTTLTVFPLPRIFASWVSSSGVLTFRVLTFLELNSQEHRSAYRVFIRFKHRYSLELGLNFVFYVLYSLYSTSALSVAPQIPLCRRMQGLKPGLCDVGIGSQTL
jgi:hypothetical protein